MITKEKEGTFMTEEQLLEEKKKNQKAYELVKYNIEAMEQTIEIQNYLKEVETKNHCETYQKFLDSLEVGEDGTIFAPQRNYRYVTFSLSEFINYAFTSKYLGQEYEGYKIPYMSLSFKEILEYSKTTRKLLKEMKHYPDEAVVENPYNLEIYPNPRENFECAESTLLRDCIFASAMYSFQEQLKLEGMTEIEEQSKCLVITDSKEKDIFHYTNFKPTDISSLSMREQNAFFGEESQKILGVKIDDTLFTKTQDDGTIQKKPLTK